MPLKFLTAVRSNGTVVYLREHDKQALPHDSIVLYFAGCGEPLQVYTGSFEGSRGGGLMRIPQVVIATGRPYDGSADETFDLAFEGPADEAWDLFHCHVSMLT